MFVLLVTSPVLAAAAIAIRMNDGGPVLFRQRRVGQNCQQFTVFKLRTMVPDAEERLGDVLESLGNGRDDVLFKLDNDPRRTKVGRFLEATSLDELPQLINVLNGSMSLVGPRPALPSEVAKFDDAPDGPLQGASPGSPASGRSRPGTTRRSPPTAASTCSTSRTGR